MRRVASFVVYLGLVVAVGPFASPAVAQSKAAIQKLNDQWATAFNKGEAAAVAAMYTKDAYVLPAGGEMVKGRAAIEALWKKNMEQLSDVKCTTADVKPLGAAAASEIGTCTFKTKSQPPQDGDIKYAVVWQKEGGQWKLAVDIWNMNK
jgi:uncharacterized protein (TIGR02246 family)